jgi:RNA polymerase sigma-70 factor (ECF subfamily)
VDLARAIEQGRAAWPAITVDEAQFAAQLAKAEPDEPLVVADLYLACACAAGDQPALDALERTYLTRLRAPLAKVGLDATGIAEALQMVREELLVAREGRTAKLLDYSGRGSLHGWLRSVAVRTGLRLVHKNPKHDELGDHHGTMTEDPELMYMKKTYGETFHRAFERALAELTAKDRLLLKQRFKHRMGVVDLGALYGVNAGTISRWVQAARDALAAETRTQMMTELGVGTVDLESILRLIHSQLEITLSSV